MGWDGPTDRRDFDCYHRNTPNETEATMPKKRRLDHQRSGEIVFDPDARRSYLQGFSDRKRQRRAFGLAMQKVKDRKAMLEDRAEMRKARKEQVEQAEKQKEELLEEYVQDHANSMAPVKFTPQNGDEGEIEKVETYEDVQTQQQWGGEVIVTTSTRIPGDSDVDEVRQEPKTRRKTVVDAQQEYAGSVDKFIAKLKGNMPGKRKDRGHKRRGKHGASSMKGMAVAGDLKIAQKVLSRSQAKLKTNRGGGGGREKPRRQK